MLYHVIPPVLVNGEDGAERGHEFEGGHHDRRAAVQPNVLEDGVSVVQDARLTGNLIYAYISCDISIVFNETA